VVLQQSVAVAIQQDLVLIGGGHSHAIVLRLWAMAPVPGVRLVLISDGADTPYSGMLPGHVAGFYDHGDCHIDLRSLCQAAGAVFYHDRAVGLDLVNQRVICADRPPVGFDYLSIDIGSTPQVELANPDLLGVSAIAAKPVPQFLAWWEALCARFAANPPTVFRLAIVGGGVGGVELALNMQPRLQALVGEGLRLHLVSRSANLLPQQRWGQQYFPQLLADRGVELHLGAAVTGWDGAVLKLETGAELACDATVWVTGAIAPNWLRDSGLAVDDRGFVQVDEGLRSVSHPAVFAAGDIAAMVAHPRPKAGVFAVRQGKPLYKNLCRVLQGEALQPFVPQKRYLSLIGTGDRQAIAIWGGIGRQLPGLWALKDRIDRRFMAKFNIFDTPVGANGVRPPARSAAIDRNLDAGGRSRAIDRFPDGGRTPFAPAGMGMRCSGCGAKVGGAVLDRALHRIQTTPSTHVLLGLDRPDDAAVLQMPPGQVLVQTVDYFPALVDDPFLFGQIATNHSLSDLFAMGASASSVLAIATIPYATESKQAEILFQLLSGALKTLALTQTALVGGHTIEGEKLMFGLTCNGFADPDRLLKKSGMQPGDCLILTKPLGTGTLFAAQMRGQAKPAWIDGAIAMMLQSNYAASQILLDCGATACTDVTGFGLLGHLVEMVRASSISVTLQMGAIPFLTGAADTTDRGIVSSLYPQNQRAQHWIANRAEIAAHRHFPLLFDPQTSGGLLASIPADRASRCCAALNIAGYSSAIIGQIQPELANAAIPITIEP
jgi:selenide, water dikinase